MENYFKVKSWGDFQHYKDRNPPWIKLHNHLLDNYEFECLPDASKAHLLCIWMLASRTQNKMPMDPQWIKRKIGASENVDLEILVKYGFIETNQPLPIAEHDASKALVSEEKRQRREEAEKIASPKVDACPYEKIKESYNEILGSDFGMVKVLSDKRKTLLKKFYKLIDGKPYTGYFSYFRDNAGPFYRGDSDRGWKATFDYIIREDTIIKVMEGNL